MIRENQRLLNQINIFTDIIILFVSLTISYFIRFFIFEGAEGYVKIMEYMKLGLFMFPVQLMLFMFFNLYSSFRSRTFRKESNLVIKANTILLGVFLGVLFVIRLVDISRWVIVGFYIINIGLNITKRFILRKTLSNIRSKGLNLKSVLIIGAGQMAYDYLQVVLKRKEYGYHYIGYVADEKSLNGKYLGNYSQLSEILKELNPDEVVCALDMREAGQLENIVNACEQSGTKISIIPFCYKYIPSQPYIDQIDNIPLINIRRIPLDNIGNAFVKRALDIVGSLCLIVLTSPIMLFASVGIKLTSKGPIIFKQERVGLNKKSFMMYKFRSMRVNNMQDTAWSTNHDPRKTKFGSFLRKFSIDELPQFFNVVKGNMSLVGPRPELPHFVENFQHEIPLYMVKHQVKPGITGWAQVNGYRGDTSIVKRIEHDIYYIENWDIFFDISILFKTVFKGIKNEEVIIKKHDRKDIENYGEDVENTNHSEKV